MSNSTRNCSVKLERDHSSGADLPRLGIVIGQLSHGGAERQTVLLAQGLRRSGILEPVVLCYSHATQPHGAELSASGVAWFCPPAAAASRLRRVLWLVGEVRRQRCALVYGVLNGGNILGGVAALAWGLPLVASVRNADSQLPRHTRALSGWFCRRAAVVVANSASCARSLRHDLGVRHGRVRVIPNALSLPAPKPDARASLRGAWGVPDGAVVMGTVANLKAQKRPAFLLAVHATLAERSLAPVHTVWIGDGPERGVVEVALARLPAAVARTLHFPGASADVADCLAAFDVFVLTSAYEGLPNALLEAMAAGLPCVATDVPGTRDVFAEAGDQEIGILADPDDPTRFAECVLALLQHPQRARRLGENAQRYVLQGYDVQHMVDAYARVFRDIMVNGHPARRSAGIQWTKRA